MKQHEEVIKIMEENGGWATLGFLYHHVDTSEWKTKNTFCYHKTNCSGRTLLFQNKSRTMGTEKSQRAAFREI